MTKEEIAQNKQFFQLLVIGYPFNYRDFLFFGKICPKLSAAELSNEGKGYCLPDDIFLESSALKTFIKGKTCNI